MKIQVSIAQLCIVDGTWQEAPDNLAVFDEQSLFNTGPARGSLFIIAEVAGDREGRDELARDLIETTRRVYANSRGSIALALTEAIQAANTSFYEHNASLAADQRRIAGISVAVLRDDELYIAQAGPGIVCLMRGNQLTRYPETSPWFNAEERPIFDDEFQTSGALPLGKRRNYIPDLFHATLQPGDIVALATRGLAHLLSNDELRDTLAQRHPDEIIANLEDLAGAADLTVIALRVAGESPAPITATPANPAPIFAPLPQEEFPVPILPVDDAEPPLNESTPEFQDEFVPPMPPTPTEEEIIRERARIEQARERNAKIRSGFLRAIGGSLGAFAGIWGRINWTGIGNGVDRAIAGLVRGMARFVSLVIDAVAPDDGQPRASKETPINAPLQTAWQLAAILFAILLVVIGTWMWFDYARNEANRIETQFLQLVDGAKTKLENGKRLPAEQRPTMMQLTQDAVADLNKALALKPNDPRALTPLGEAQNFLLQLNGYALVATPPPLAVFDSQANLTRVVVRFPEVFILDKASARIYRLTISDAGGTPAAPRVILKTGDRAGDRIASQFNDIALLDANRLLAFDRNGAFLVYDIARGEWNGRSAGDPTFWSRIPVASAYTNIAYLVDPLQNQIFKYVPQGDGWWTSSVTYFMPGANPSLADVADLSIDGDMWLLRNSGALLQCNPSRCNETAIAGLDPLSKPVTAFTTPALGFIYIADAGNQRIVQIDKGASRIARLFKANVQNPDIFKSLKSIAVDNQRLFVLSENKAYMVNLAQ